jgi:hypothetical protein
MTERTNDEKWRLLLRKGFAEEGARLRAQHPEWEPTSECPPLPLFLRCNRGGDWEKHYQEHFATGCPYCKRQLEIAARLERGQAAVDQNILRPLVFMLLRSRLVSAAPRRGDPNTMTAAAPDEQRWLLTPATDRVETADGPAYRLPEEIVRRSYDVPEGVNVDLRIELLLKKELNGWVPTVEISPGPHPGKGALRLRLRFATDCDRQFVIHPHAFIKMKSLHSEAVAPIPASVVEGWKTAEDSAVVAEFCAD